MNMILIPHVLQDNEFYKWNRKNDFLLACSSQSDICEEGHGYSMNDCELQ